MRSALAVVLIWSACGDGESACGVANPTSLGMALSMRDGTFCNVYLFGPFNGCGLVYNHSLVADDGKRRGACSIDDGTAELLFSDATSVESPTPGAGVAAPCAGDWVSGQMWHVNDYAVSWSQSFGPGEAPVGAGRIVCELAARCPVQGVQCIE